MPALQRRMDNPSTEPKPGADEESRATRSLPVRRLQIPVRTAINYWLDLALALLCAGDRVRSFMEYSRGVHQAVNGGVDRLRGVVAVALDDLDECLAERPALATTREAVAARALLHPCLPLPFHHRVLLPQPNGATLVPKAAFLPVVLRHGSW